MSAVLIDGKAIAARIQEELREEVAALRSAGVAPCLHVLLVGENPASQAYVRTKRRVAAGLGIEAQDHMLPAATAEAEIVALVERLNADRGVHGILVQTPLPEHVDTRRVLGSVDPAKDVDGLHPFNLGNLVKGSIALPPCTPAGIMELLRRSGVALRGAQVVVLGRSDLVGKPVSLLLLHENATVTICHSRTQHLAEVCRRAEVLVVAIGRPRMITPEFVRPAAVVIDVGINREGDRLVGDVDFDTVRFVASAITPVPGGVGPMTVAMLMRNTLTAARLQQAAGPTPTE